ncbi:hypothetical protein IWX86_001888 [Polaromonas sp. CG_9.2]|nr:hypothetical protein [Polaromonas sp. CG_9.2]MDH6184786.1 hypothetical protein [Polaromonas sp. CG_23.6]
MHDVGNGGSAVNDDPLTVVFALNAGLGKTGVAHSVAHAGSKRLGLAVGRARSNNHALKQRCDVFGIKHLNVLRLDIFKPIDNGALKFLDIFFALGA